MAVTRRDWSESGIAAPDAELIIRLRLLVARSAQSDGLSWWDDRSLTAEGLYLAERLFSRRPHLAAAKIALRTAAARHAASMPADGAVHLYDLGEQAEHALSGVSLDEAWTPAAAPGSPEAFLDAVGALVPDGVGYLTEYAGQRQLLAGPLEIRLSPEADPKLEPTVARACALALAYTEAGQGRPVYPFMKV
jgi:hypothetical protein